MTGSSDSNRSESQGGLREEGQLKEGRSQGTTVGRRTGREAAMRAMSVRENAKSKSHRKTHRVEPDGTGREFMHLTRGGLARESAGGVSRGRSSEEARVMAGGAKGRRDRRRRDRRTSPPVRARRTLKHAGRDNYGHHPARCEKQGRVESRLEIEHGVRVARRARGGER